MNVYQEIVFDIKGKIDEGFYKPGDRLPSERSLSEAYDVSRMTVRHALGELEREGIVFKEQGRGTYVSQVHLWQENLTSFTETLKKRGLEPSSKVIEFSTVHHLSEISEAMGLPIDTKFFKLKRLRYGNDMPIALETNYLPVDSFPGMKRFDMSKSLYSVIEKEYGYSIERLSCEMDAVLSNRSLIDAMQLQKPQALLKVSAIAYTTKDRKLFYEESYYRADIYKYSVDIKR